MSNEYVLIFVQLDCMNYSNQLLININESSIA